MKKIFICVVLTLSLFCNLFAQNNSSDQKDKTEKTNFTFIDQTDIFRLRPLTDGLLLGTGVGLIGLDHGLEFLAKLNQIDYRTGNFGAGASRDNIPTLDALLMHGYSKPLNYISWGTLALTALTPAIFAFTEPSNHWLTIGVMYAEAMLLTTGIKDLAKNLVIRPRPYMYYDLSMAPQDHLADYDWENSFFSGHTAWAFTAASFTSYVFCQYNPDSKLRFAVIGGTFGAAALTAVLRVAGGNHFASDVLCGAVAGTIAGFIVPYLHTIPFWKNNNNVELSILPNGFLIAARL